MLSSSDATSSTDESTPRLATSADQSPVEDACARTFMTTELLDKIVLHLPDSSIYGIQRVCGQFRDIVDTSPAIRRRLLLLEEQKQRESQWYLNKTVTPGRGPKIFTFSKTSGSDGEERPFLLAKRNPMFEVEGRRGDGIQDAARRIGDRDGDTLVLHKHNTRLALNLNQSWQQALPCDPVPEVLWLKIWYETRDDSSRTASGFLERRLEGVAERASGTIDDLIACALWRRGTVSETWPDSNECYRNVRFVFGDQGFEQVAGEVGVANPGSWSSWHLRLELEETAVSG